MFRIINQADLVNTQNHHSVSIVCILVRSMWAFRILFLVTVTTSLKPSLITTLFCFMKHTQGVYPAHSSTLETLNHDIPQHHCEALYAVITIRT